MTMLYRCPGKNSNSKWGWGTFILSKKAGEVHAVCKDFRKLNKEIKRKAYPIRLIRELLQSLAGFRRAAALDLSMGYFLIPLDENCKGLSCLGENINIKDCLLWA
jgi:hypothetical protein